MGSVVGLTDEQIERLRCGEAPGLGDAVDDACLEVARALLRGDVTDEEWARWVPVVGPGVVFELTTLVGYYATLALQLRVFQVGVEVD